MHFSSSYSAYVTEHVCKVYTVEIISSLPATYNEFINTVYSDTDILPA